MANKKLSTPAFIPWLGLNPSVDNIELSIRISYLRRWSICVYLYCRIDIVKKMEKSELVVTKIPHILFIGHTFMQVIL